MKTIARLILTISFLLPLLAQGQSRATGFAGMWSDPPDTPEGLFCFFNCSDYALEVLVRLLDDPANDDRSYGELTSQARREFNQNVLIPKLTEAAMENYPLSPSTDPGFINCEPWGFAREIFSPHQNEITIGDDHVQMHYGEWDVRRTIYTDGRRPPAGLQPSKMGYSVGRFEGDTLVVTTTHVAAGRMAGFEHSDQLTAEERYTVSDDGQILTLYATFDDPASLKEPITWKKIWKWSPDEEIYPYTECEIPTDFLEFRGNQ